MTKHTEDTVIERIGGLLESSLDDEVVMLNIERGNYYGLSGVAKRIWEHLERPKSIAELCCLLQAEFDVAPQQCLHEVIGFVEQMIEEKMVRVAS